ncbi:MAG: hypothetical protein VYD89_03025, partial [Candidatus Thermoplasmatota archaeon]|nr:hypothetical protein [Candidatus Thermoplasmatota archaeon]
MLNPSLWVIGAEGDKEDDTMQTRTEKGGKNSEGPIGTGLVIERRFTTIGEDPFDQFDWIEMDVEIRNADGSLAHRIDDVR